MNTETLNNIFTKEGRCKMLEMMLNEMAETTLEYEKVEFNGMLGKVTFEVNTELNTQPTVKSIKDEIERRYNDNIRAVEMCGENSPHSKSIFGSAAKEDF